MPAVAELDLLLVGGGPAGLATAIAARAAGLGPVRVVERFRPPIDKACGEGLMPDGAACLGRLGVSLDRLHAAPFRGIRYLDGEVVAEGSFPEGVGLGLRRTVLHAALVRRAEEVGVELAWGVKVEGRSDAGVRTDHGAMTATWLVAADGLNSRLRRWAGLGGREVSLGARRRFGVRRHYRVEAWTDLVEVYWADRCEAYVTPVGPDEVGVAILWSGGPARFDDLLGHFPRLETRLAGAAATSRDRGAGPLLQRVRRVVRGNLALVGDAAGYLDAITGEGLSLAFHQAEALAAALAAGDLRRYERAHARIGRLPNALTRLVLAIDRHPGLRRRAIGALAADRELFSRLLGVHSRSLALRQVGLGGLARLVGRMAAA